MQHLRAVMVALAEGTVMVALAETLETVMVALAETVAVVFLVRIRTNYAFDILASDSVELRAISIETSCDESLGVGFMGQP